MMKYMALLVLGLTLGSCGKKATTVDQGTLDQQTISTYITNNKLTTQATSTGINYVITTAGFGSGPISTSNVTFSYKGYLTDGTVFVQSPSAGTTSSMQLLIAGLQQGLRLFKKGGKGTLLIPSALGYGTVANGLIPANGILIFDIEMLDIQ